MTETTPPYIDELAQVNEILSPREREILGLWLKGYGVRRTRLLTGLAESTIRTYRSRIKDKLATLDAVKEAC